MHGWAFYFLNLVQWSSLQLENCNWDKHFTTHRGEPAFITWHADKKVLLPVRNNTRNELSNRSHGLQNLTRCTTIPCTHLVRSQSADGVGNQYTMEHHGGTVGVDANLWWEEISPSILLKASWEHSTGTAACTAVEESACMMGCLQGHTHTHTFTLLVWTCLCRGTYWLKCMWRLASKRFTPWKAQIQKMHFIISLKNANFIMNKVIAT